jgi:hypothetical protein
MSTRRKAVVFGVFSKSNIFRHNTVSLFFLSGAALLKKKKTLRRKKKKKKKKKKRGKKSFTFPVLPSLIKNTHIKNLRREEGAKQREEELRTTKMTDAGTTNTTNNNKDRDELFNNLCRKKGNRLCFDCNTPNPKWTSKNYCVFICLDCSGIHRSLGVHISQVKSANMDRWSRDELDVFKASGGNDAARAFFSQHGWNSNERGKR